MSRWPPVRFAAVPPLATAAGLADSIRKLTLDSPSVEHGLCRLEQICASGGFLVRRATLGRREMGHQALLVPMPQGGFEIIVDPRAGVSVPDEETARHRFRFRVAHEVAHSFFYDRSVRPAGRIIPTSLEEEAFCDMFASALLLPPSVVEVAAPSAEAVLSLRRTHAVSAEVAGRALARAQRGITVMGLMKRVNPRDGIEGLRVIWKEGPQYVPSGARLRSKVVDAAYTESRASGLETLRVGGLKGVFSIDAARLPRGLQVVAVLRRVEQ